MKIFKTLLLIFEVITISIILYAIIVVSIKSDSNFIYKNQKNVGDNNRIIFISDTQEPIWLETIILDRNNNLKARELLFSEIVNKKPNDLFHLGDIVAFGFDNREWKPIESYLTKFYKIGINFYPVLGNHELMIFPIAGLKNYLRRFPYSDTVGEIIHRGNIAIILLNSNISTLSQYEAETQLFWFEKKLEELERNLSINGVIVGCHHSPFTNSKIVNPDIYVQDNFVSIFLKYSKAKVFISGHCHAFEHFQVEGKDFLVIGGGGGLQQPLYIGVNQKWNDLFSSTQKRMFHFLELEVSKNHLVFSLNQIDSNFTSFNNDYQIKIKL